MAGTFGRRRVPRVSQADIKCEVGLPLEAILRKGVVRGLENLVISRAELDRERLSVPVQEVLHRANSRGVEREASHVERNVVVVGAPNFTTKVEGMPPSHPTHTIIHAT